MKLNPITTLYYVAPCCFAFLLVPFAMLEAPKIINDDSVQMSVPLFLSNCTCAFGAPTTSTG